MGVMLVVTEWYLKITTRHLQHDGRHVGSYRVVPEDYYVAFRIYNMMGAMLVVTTWSLNMKITTRHLQHDWAMLVVTMWTLNLKITKQHLQHIGRRFGSYHVDIIPEDNYAAFTTRWAQCW
jgi:hypothetical protein